MQYDKKIQRYFFYYKTDTPLWGVSYITIFFQIKTDILLTGSIVHDTWREVSYITKKDATRKGWRQDYSL